MDENLYPMIFKRKSFHLFKNIGAISQRELSQIENFFRKCKPLIPEIPVEMRIVPAAETTCKRGQEFCILLYSEKREGYLPNIGYIGQQLDLMLASMNIGTLWFGIGKTEVGSESGLDFVIMLAIAKVEETAFRKDMFKSKRKPLEEIWIGELLSEIRRRRKWQQMGQQVHKYKNLLNREFHADRPNSKWVTDISYIHTKQGILYLSMIRDLYDNTIVAYKTGTEQTVNLVLDTIHLAMKQVKKKAAAELQLHSDQGFQYTSQAYFKLTKQYGITPSMSRKGNPYDNAMAENFFSILKTECIYRHRPATFAQANEIIDRYIYFYNHERIQLKTGEAPLARRLST